MSSFRNQQGWCGLAALCVVSVHVMIAGGCGLTVTRERPTYGELDPPEKQAVDQILAELKPLDAQIRARSQAASGKLYTLDPIVNKERINVSFEGLIFTYNLGDGVIHVASWENLTAAQRTVIGTWFKTSGAATETQYKKLFYQFMAVVQGVKQFMYNSLTATWVFANRSVFNIERDAARTALAHYVAVGRKTEMWGFTQTLCVPVLSQYQSRYGSMFTLQEAASNYKAAKAYMAANFAEMASPDNPIGWMYFTCQWITMGQADASDLTEEMRWIVELPLPTR